MVDGIKAAIENEAEFITYGDSDLGKAIPIWDGLADIMGMDDEMIGDGTWYVCDEDGQVK